MELILASTSPRRKNLLTEAGFVFRTIDPGAVEEQISVGGQSAVQQARSLALAKAQRVAAGLEKALVLGADTVVALGDHVLGKPRHLDHAREILQMLSGSRHKVITALALVNTQTEKCLLEHEQTSLTMARLSSEQIEDYLASSLWRGKAGAYALQENDTYITDIQGSFSNVVGLPMELLERMLNRFVPDKSLWEFRL